MRFSGNRAWQDAIGLISANREVLLVIAGVFIFLPNLLTSFFMKGVQQRMLAMLPRLQHAATPAAVQPFITLYAHLAPWLLVIMVAQAVGICAMLALLTDHRRPTVGEALVIGLKSLPTLIGVGLIFILGYILLAGVAVMGIGVVAMAVPVLAVLLAIAAFVGVMWLAMRFLLIQPVVVIEREMNPFRAIAASWRLTGGNAWRLLGFFLLLLIAYVVLMVVVSMVMGVLLMFAAGAARLASASGQSPIVTLGSGIVSGLLGAGFIVVFTGLLAAIHRQLAGPSAEAIADTFA